MQNKMLVGIVLLLLLLASVLLPISKASETADPTETLSRIYLPLVTTSDPWAQVDPSGQSIVFWHHHSREREIELHDIVDEFNATNPWGIQVSAQYQGGNHDIYYKMLGVLNTPAAPDLVLAYQSQAAAYQLDNGLVDLRTLVDSRRWGLSTADKADFFQPVYQQDVFPTFGNARLGFPPDRRMILMYFNVDWLVEMGYATSPLTPAQFGEMACAAIDSPFSGRIGDRSMGYQFVPAAYTFVSWVFAFGGDIFDSESQRYTLNSEEAIQAMTFIQDLVDRGCAELVQDKYDDQLEFGVGRLLFTTGSSSGLPYYQHAVSDGAQFDWSIDAIAHLPTEPQPLIFGASISIPLHTRERELAAWLFLKYYTSSEVQAGWARATRYLPVRQSTADYLGDYFDENPRYEKAFSLLPYGKSAPSVPYYCCHYNGHPNVSDLIAQAFRDIVQGASVSSRLGQLNVEANATLPQPYWEDSVSTIHTGPSSRSR